MNPHWKLRFGKGSKHSNGYERCKLRRFVILSLLSIYFVAPAAAAAAANLPMASKIHYTTLQSFLEHF